MPLKIRLARGGAKKRPMYRIVVADSRARRDGRFIERVGTYQPLLPKDDPRRVAMNLERVRFWIARGARPTDRVATFLDRDPGGAAPAADGTEERDDSGNGEPAALAEGDTGDAQESAS